LPTLQGPSIPSQTAQPDFSALLQQLAQAMQQAQGQPTMTAQASGPAIPQNAPQGQQGPLDTEAMIRAAMSHALR